MIPIHKLENALSPLERLRQELSLDRNGSGRRPCRPSHDEICKSFPVRGLRKKYSMTGPSEKLTSSEILCHGAPSYFWQTCTKLGIRHSSFPSFLYIEAAIASPSDRLIYVKLPVHVHINPSHHEAKQISEGSGELLPTSPTFPPPFCCELSVNQFLEVESESQ